MDKIKPVLDWIKGHLLISAMSLLIIAFIACGWYYAGALNVELKTEVTDRIKEFQKVETAAKAPVKLTLVDAGVNGSGTLNKQLLDKLDVFATRMGSDLDEAKVSVLLHNGDPFADAGGGGDDASETPAATHPGYQDRLASEGPFYPGNVGTAGLREWKSYEQDRRARGAKRTLVSERLFPNPRASKRENLQNEVHAALVASYADLLDDAGAGTPPNSAAVDDELLMEQSNYIQQDLNKGTVSDLEPEELELLRKKLSNERLKVYNEAADKITFYADTSAFNLPVDPFVSKTMHGLGDLYEWHWDWWIAEDIVAAIASANSDEQGNGIGVAFAPVKELIRLKTLDGPIVNAKGGGNASSSGGRGSGKSRGGRGGGGNTPDPSEAGGPLPEPDVSMDVATNTDFSVSLTGRSSNALYDVRTVELVVIVETTKLPVLVDALARENFMTITNIALAPTSNFDAARRGYIFGAEPVSRVTMEIETIWFRKWTAAWMPQEVRDALGVKSKGT